MQKTNYNWPLSRTLGLSLVLGLSAPSPSTLAEAKKAKKPAADHKAEEPQEGAAPSNEFTITNKYIHKWVKMPELHGRSVVSEENFRFTTERGMAEVVIFLASWCLPCQQIIMEIKRLEEKYRERHTRFLYVFTHDTLVDAKGFAQAYKLEGALMMANAKILEDFHQPELPTIYLADRMEWITMRLVDADAKALAKLDKFLDVHTAY
jgi:thiol-disulfide isomerase/thioredoxin